MIGSRNLLLVSSSRIHGSGYLDHAEGQVRDLLDKVKSVLFVPYALKDRDGYAGRVRARFEAMGISFASVHTLTNPEKAIQEAEALFIGGGNTFRLLKTLYDLQLLDDIRQRVDSGMPFMGSSAGTNVACPTIKTTNDMPIVQPPSFQALGLVPFQVNPHYLDPDPASTHMGETREERIREFHEENDVPVIGLREASMIRIYAGSIVLKGTANTRLFRKGMDPLELPPETQLNSYL